jgi:hypothetical protein
MVLRFSKIYTKMLGAKPKRAKQTGMSITAVTQKHTLPQKLRSGRSSGASKTLSISVVKNTMPEQA